MHKNTVETMDLMNQAELSFNAIWTKMGVSTPMSRESGWAVFCSVNQVLDAGIPGALVDCRASEPGSAMLIAHALLARGISDRDLVLIDLFHDAPANAEGSGEGHQNTPPEKIENHPSNNGRMGMADIRDMLISAGYPEKRIRFVQADTRTQLPKIHTSLISFLRLNPANPDHAYTELENLYPRVSSGAPIIIGSFAGKEGCQESVSRYFAEEVTAGHHNWPLMWQISQGGCGFVKQEKPLKADIERYDYVPPGMDDAKLLPLFGEAFEVNPWTIRWKYLRPRAPHQFRSDRRNQKAFHIGYASYEEATCLYNLARQFKGKRGLEIGSYFGWTTAHLRAAGLRLDCVDPAFADLNRAQAVRDVLDAIESDMPYTLTPAASPDCIAELAEEQPEEWSFAFIDGNHEAPSPAQDAEAVLPHLSKDAMVVFHDLTSPDVAAGLRVMADAGWTVTLFNTMQILGIAWRGSVTIPNHLPDPNVPEIYLEHLNFIADREYAGAVT